MYLENGGGGKEKIKRKNYFVWCARKRNGKKIICFFFFKFNFLYPYEVKIGIQINEIFFFFWKHLEVKLWFCNFFFFKLCFSQFLPKLGGNGKPKCGSK